MPDATHENLDPPSSPAQLDYAKRPPLAWIGRYRWRLVLLAVCIAVAVPVYRNWRPLKQRVLWLYWSHRAAAHVMPGPIELMVWDPVELKKLAATNPDYHFYGGSQANYIPKALAQLMQLDPRLATIASKGAPVAFLGTLSRPDGVRRLVIVYGSWGTSNNLLQGVDALVLPLPGLFDSLGQAPPSFDGLLRIGPGPPSQLRGGVPDVHNTSHITFQFVIGQSVYSNIASMTERHPGRGVNYVDPNEIVGQGVIDAYLQNDDTLTLNLREASGSESVVTLGTSFLPQSEIPPLVPRTQMMPKFNAAAAEFRKPRSPVATNSVGLRQAAAAGVGEPAQEAADFLAVCVAIAIPIYRNWQPLKHRILWLYWSRQAADHVMPASAELSVTDPNRAAGLLAANPDYAPVTMRHSATQPSVTGAIYHPRAMAELQKIDPRLNWVSGFRPSPEPIAFMGTLRRPDGIGRLVIIPRGGEMYQGIDRLPMLVLPLPGWFDPLPNGTYSQYGGGFIPMGNGYLEAMELGAATLDPADPSHLIVPFVINKGSLQVAFTGGAFRPMTELEKGVFDVYLRNDDSLLFRLRADSSQSIALRLKKETVVAGSPAATPAPRPRSPATSAPRATLPKSNQGQTGRSNGQ